MEEKEQIAKNLKELFEPQKDEKINPKDCNGETEEEKLQDWWKKTVGPEIVVSKDEDVTSEANSFPEGTKSVFEIVKENQDK